MKFGEWWMKKDIVSKFWPKFHMEIAWNAALKYGSEKPSYNKASRQLPTFEEFRGWYHDKTMAHEASDLFRFFTGNWPT